LAEVYNRSANYKYYALVDCQPILVSFLEQLVLRYRR